MQAPPTMISFYLNDLVCVLRLMHSDCQQINLLHSQCCLEVITSQSIFVTSPTANHLTFIPSCVLYQSLVFDIVVLSENSHSGDGPPTSKSWFGHFTCSSDLESWDGIVVLFLLHCLQFLLPFLGIQDQVATLVWFPGSICLVLWDNYRGNKA